MGFQYRKSKNLGNGTRINVGKNSVGISTGVKGARVSFNSKGQGRINFSIPGTGFRYTKTINGCGALMMLFAPIINIMVYLCKISFIFCWWICKIFFCLIYYFFVYTFNGMKKLFCIIKDFICKSNKE